jgi:hypothetical protein
MIARTGLVSTYVLLFTLSWLGGGVAGRRTALALTRQIVDKKHAPDSAMEEVARWG